MRIIHREALSDVSAILSARSKGGNEMRLTPSKTSILTRQRRISHIGAS
jgi:hypothetical protein